MKQVSKIILSASFAAALLVGCGGGGSSSNPVADAQDVAKNFKGVWVADSKDGGIKGCTNGPVFSDGTGSSRLETLTIEDKEIKDNIVKYSELECTSDSLDTNYTITYNYKLDITKSATTKSGTKVYAIDFTKTKFELHNGEVTNASLIKIGTKYYAAIGKNSKNLIVLEGTKDKIKRDKFLENNVSKLNDSDEDILRLIKK